MADINSDYIENGIIKESHSVYKTSGISFNNGMVAYSIERPKFMRMISLLTQNTVKGCIVLCWDRISRNPQDDLLIEELIKDANIQVHFVQTEYANNASVKIHRGIDALFSAFSSAKTSERVKSTFCKLRSEKCTTHKAPIGYLDKGSDNKVPDPERAKSIQRLFELYSTGEWSLSQLHKWTPEQGMTTKPQRKKGDKKSKPRTRSLSKSSIEFILKNPYYIGKISYKGEVMEGRHPPLIDIYTFNRVQEVLKSKNVTIKYMVKSFLHTVGSLIVNVGGYTRPTLRTSTK